jgi:HK97 family phage major capsid protein
MENQDVILAAITEHSEKFTKAQHALSVQQNEAAERLAGIEQEVAAMKGRSIHGGGNVDAAPSVSAEFIKSAQMQAMRDGAPGTGRVTLKTGGIKTLTKALNNSGVGQASGNQDYSVQPNRDVSNLWNQPQRRLSLIDALRVLPVSAAAFEYMQLTGFTNAAAVQSKEGDTKAEQTVATTIVTSQIATVAAFVRSSLQVTEDAPQLAYQLDNLLGYGCMAKLENLLINGAGNATDRIKGLLAYATAATTSATAAADMIGEALDELDSNGWQASVIVLNPADWGAIQRERSTSNGQYILGSARNPAPPSLWSVPVVTSPSLAAGTALVLDGSQLALLDRQEVSVMSSREDGTNFVTNQVTTLAELRAGLAVFSPGAVLSVDLSPTT